MFTSNFDRCLVDAREKKAREKKNGIEKKQEKKKSHWRVLLCVASHPWRQKIRLIHLKSNKNEDGITIFTIVWCHVMC